jgi:hypothetical protein
LTDIDPLYPQRDESRPTIATHLLDRHIRKGLGATLVEYVSQREATLLTTFYVPAIAADRLGYERVYCVVTDADVNRVWAPLDPASSHITYLVPSHRARRRLRAYGVRESRIRMTGFPLPASLIGGTDLAVLRHGLARRLVRLDPAGTFREEIKHSFGHFLGPLPNLRGEDAIPLLTFAVGGAGAQVDLVRSFLPSLRGLLREGRLRVALVAGIRREVALALRRTVSSAGMDRLATSTGPVQVICEDSFEDYLKTFNALLARTDILWTKPSELTFFIGLGLPLVLSPAVGSHEEYNRRWAREHGGGLKQRDARCAGEWLRDWLNDGILAAAAWHGFTQAPKFGLHHILEALDSARVTPDSAPPSSS